MQTQVLTVTCVSSNNFGDQIIHVINQRTGEQEVITRNEGEWLSLPCRKTYEVWITSENFQTKVYKRKLGYYKKVS